MRDKLRKHRKTDSLLFRTALVFGIFTVVTLFVSAATIYAIQMKDYKARKMKDIRNIGDYLERLIQDSGKDFISYQNYYMEHFAEANIPYNFDEYLTAQRKYEAILAAQPAVKDTSNFDFDSLSDEAKMAYFIYIHEYWILTFENARKSFNLPYTYYLVPKEEEYRMVYMIDGERSHKDTKGNKSNWGEYLYLGDEYYDPPEKYEIQWRTWFSGQRQDDFEVWDNEWGHTYAYYVPLIIDGKKLGLIGTEVEVAAVNEAILWTSLKISGGIALALIICSIFMMLYLNKRYLQKIAKLESRMFEFSREKNVEIAKTIKAEARGRDEISNLSRRFADLILEIADYVNMLLTAKKELKDTKQLADEMNELAKKDTLTGVRNKTAYDNEARRLDWKAADGQTDFGLAMIDMNYLKRINDNCGHQQGNIAIKNLCKIICDIFKHSPVFRVGGDEFVVVLENSDFANIDKLVTEFKAKIDLLAKEENLDPWNKVSAAIGYAVFKNGDTTTADVFRRADRKMYEHKNQMKAARKA